MAEMDYGQIKDKLIVELVGADRNALALCSASRRK